MTVELIQAIGKSIVTPICFAVVAIAYIYYTLRDR